MGQGAHLPWYYSPVWIGVLAVFALGPFVLPIVWKSPKLTPAARWVWTALIALFTLYLVYSFQRTMETFGPLLGWK